MTTIARRLLSAAIASTFMLVGAAGVWAQIAPVPRHPQIERRTPATPPPLPISTGTPQPDATARAKRSFSGAALTRVHVKPVAVPSLAVARRALAGRRTRNAAGGTITLIGDHNQVSNANAPLIADYTLGYGSQIGFDCSNLTPNESNIQYIVFAPDGTQFGSPPTLSTDGNGNCQSDLKDVTLATPYGSGTDAPYPAVWAVAIYRTGSSDYEAVSYFVVQSQTTFSTYSDGALNFPTRDFTKGQTIYVVANSLNPSDAYALGWVQTAKPPINCVYALPSTYRSSGPNCFDKNLAGLTGTVATSGQFEGAWVTSTSNVSGSYAVQLYDVTRQRLVATQPVTLRATTDPVITLSAYAAGAATAGASIGDDAFAHDGLADASVGGLGYSASGLSANHQYVLSVSNPNGTVLGTPLTATQSEEHAVAPARFTTNGSGALSTGRVDFPLSSTKSTALGPTQTSFGGTSLTMQLWDPSSSSVAASKTFKLLGYAATLAWNGVNSVNADPGTCSNTTHNTLTVTNDAATLYGVGGADGIVGVAIGPDSSNFISVCTVNGALTATDSAGHTWNISTTTFGGATYVVATIQKVAATDALPVGGTLSFNIDLGAPSSRCASTPPCALRTRILPLHGISYSADNSVTNGLLVGGKNNAINPSVYGWSVTTPSPGGSILAPPPFGQMMYVSGTNATTSTNTYTLVATVANNNNSGTTQTINDIAFTFPPGFDFTVAANKPTSVSVKNGGSTLSGWQVVTGNGSSNNIPNANTFAIWCGTSNSASPCSGAIQPGTQVTVTLTLPMPAISFALYPISATGNFDGGCINNTGASKCTYTSTPLVSNGTLASTVAGPVNLDSTQLGVYSLNTTKMSGVFTPQRVGSGVPTSTTFTFTNTSASADPNPDYVDAIALSFPAGADPGLAGITAPTGWTASGSAGTYTLTANACTGVPCQEAYAISPGGTLAVPIAYTGATAGTYTVTWTVRGANGGTTTTTSGSSQLLVTPTSASVQFQAAGGYPTATAVSSGAEPLIGSDADSTYGNAYDYRVSNTGQDTITALTITVPWKNRFGTAGTDSGGTNWTFTKAGSAVVTIVPSTAGHGCTTIATPVSPTSSVNGHIDLSGCNVQKGDYLDVKFTLLAPYQIGSEFDFTTVVCSATATCSGTGPFTGGIAAAPAYGTAEYLKIVADARLSIVFSNGAPTVGQTPVLPNPAPGGSAPVTSCTGTCTVTAISPLPIIDFGSFAGTFTASDIFDVVVTSDVNTPNTWQLLVSVDNNPTGSHGAENSMLVDAAHTNIPAGYTIPAAAQSFFALPVNAGYGSGTSIGTYNGNARRSPVDSIQSIKVDNTGDSAGHTIQLNYTLIVN